MLSAYVNWWRKNMWPFKTEIIIKPKYFRIRSPKKGESLLFCFEGVRSQEELEYIRKGILTMFSEKSRKRIGMIAGAEVKIIKQK